MQREEWKLFKLEMAACGVFVGFIWLGLHVVSYFV